MPVLTRLLTEADGDPVAIENAAGKGDVVLVCEHASRRVPERGGKTPRGR